ncbi:MAG: IspD/TarI family cytidylyltransferase [Acidimicrobiia bacterium]
MTDAVTFAAVIVAAGQGTRFGKPKHTLTIDGVPLWQRCANTFGEAGVTSVVVVGDVPGGIPGGERRRDSVLNGVRAVPHADWVLIHDAARALVTPDLVTSIMDRARSTASCGVIPGIPVTDTIKRVEGGQVAETLDRSSLIAVQTPQAFQRDALVEAHEADLSLDATDDAALVEQRFGTVDVVPGDPENIKITFPSDLEQARRIAHERGAT